MTRIDAEALAGFVGREVHYPAREALSRASIRYFQLALGDENPLYLDDDFARAAGFRSLIAPPTLICETCQYAHQPPDELGYIGHDWKLPVADCRLIRVGNEYAFERPVYPDDEISVTWTLAEIAPRSSSRGGQQIFVTSVARYASHTGDLLATNRETVVLQPIDTGSRAQVSPAPEARSVAGAARPTADPRRAGAKPPLPRDGDVIPAFERNITNAEIMAYGAATWDWHRTHYDYLLAREHDLPDVMLDGQSYGAMFARGLVDWLGPTTFVRHLGYRMRTMVLPGDTLRLEGTVTGVEPIGSGLRVTAAQRLQVGERLVADATTLVELPRANGNADG